MKTSKLAFGLLLLLPWVGSTAQADLDVLVLGSATSSTLADQGNNYSSSNLGIGYGFLLSERILKDWNLQFGGVTFDRRVVSPRLSSRSSLVLPLVFAYRLASGFKLDLGGYYDLALGTPEAGMQAWTFGSLVGAQFDLPLLPGMGLALGAHYLVQLRALSTVPSEASRYSDLWFTVGLRFGTTR
ncbi:MAG: hypothetical protein RJB38_380 [Pseudomonadota bacterium]|jgi:hypothetical protein